MRTASLAMAGLLAIGVSACGSVDQVDGPLGAAQQAEIDPGYRHYLIYTLADGNGTQLGQVLVTATASPDGTYAANVEYWYLTSNLSNSAAVTITGGTSQYWSTPPSGLGTLSFSTERTPSWTYGTMSSGTLLEYSNGFTGELDAINWGMSESNGSWTGSITWWHNSTGNMFGDGVSRTLSPTTASGTGLAYYYVTDPL